MLWETVGATGRPRLTGSEALAQRTGAALHDCTPSAAGLLPTQPHFFALLQLAFPHFSAGMASLVRTLKSVDLPTFGSPTMPTCSSAGNCRLLLGCG